jgi:amidase
VHPDCTAATEDAGKLLASLGHDVELSHPAELDTNFFHRREFIVSAASHIVLQIRELEEELGRTLQRDELEDVTWACLEGIGGVLGSELYHAQHHNRLAAVRYASWWDQGFDLLLTPTIAVAPYRIPALSPPSAEDQFPDVAAWVPFTPHVNGAGFPAVSVPLWWNADDLPIGVQLVASYGREDQLLQVSSQLEQARPWVDRRPPIFA